MCGKSPDGGTPEVERDQSTKDLLCQIQDFDIGPTSLVFERFLERSNMV